MIPMCTLSSGTSGDNTVVPVPAINAWKLRTTVMRVLTTFAIARADVAAFLYLPMPARRLTPQLVDSLRGSSYLFLQEI
jgi:phenylacetate-coenzyme A ligase PaaK-like adenylate-forming protein